MPSPFVSLRILAISRRVYQRRGTFTPEYESFHSDAAPGKPLGAAINIHFYNDWESVSHALDVCLLGQFGHSVDMHHIRLVWHHHFLCTGHISERVLDNGSGR